LIKCTVCGLEYSYGRSICHICKDHTIYSGIIFKEKKKSYEWNCSTASRFKREDRGFLRSFELGRDLDSEYTTKIEERINYEWNCDASIRLNDFQTDGKEVSCSLIYE